MLSLFTPMSDRKSPHLLPSTSILQKTIAPSRLPNNSIFSGCLAGSEPSLSEPR
jgi:hypothetical protein